mmetsp:Transcript_29105/g.57853  ORF Transcript_29105/g.57853 Transcript_29105/m.57853 type:complete len:85 (-) Transcript_29105:25-279(-)
MADCKDGEDGNGGTAAVERNVMVAAQMASAVARTATAARAGCDCGDVQMLATRTVAVARTAAVIGTVQGGGEDGEVGANDNKTK